ncbi:hypothetical protein [Streptomyces sp. NPDC048428]|uniref:hypothetical protein n=1 Tax=Streptomyces sp. NPDC048428 TaxID=3154503 RepID=UPI00344361F3
MADWEAGRLVAGPADEAAYLRLLTRLQAQLPAAFEPDWAALRRRPVDSAAPSVPAARPARTGNPAREAGPSVRLEIGDTGRRYCLNADPAADGLMDLTVTVCSPDGVIQGELSGRIGLQDLGEIGRLVTSAGHACTTPAQAPTPQPRQAPAHVRATRPGEPWTSEAERYLGDNYREGRTPEQLAGELGRSENSVRWRLFALALAPRPTPAQPAAPRPAVAEPLKAYTVLEKRQAHRNAYQRWTPDEEEDLLNRCAQGVSLSALAEMFGRGEGAIASRLMKVDAVGPAADEAVEFGG